MDAAVAVARECMSALHTARTEARRCLWGLLWGSPWIPVGLPVHVATDGAATVARDEYTWRTHKETKPLSDDTSFAS